jgi:hypothetical protein
VRKVERSLDERKLVWDLIGRRRRLWTWLETGLTEHECSRDEERYVDGQREQGSHDRRAVVPSDQLLPFLAHLQLRDEQPSLSVWAIEGTYGECDGRFELRKGLALPCSCLVVLPLDRLTYGAQLWHDELFHAAGSTTLPYGKRQGRRQPEHDGGNDDERGVGGREGQMARDVEKNICCSGNEALRRIEGVTVVGAPSGRGAREGAMGGIRETSR